VKSASRSRLGADGHAPSLAGAHAMQSGSIEVLGGDMRDATHRRLTWPIAFASPFCVAYGICWRENAELWRLEALRSEMQERAHIGQTP